MKRPNLEPLPLAEILPLGVKPEVVVTMSVEQWDDVLSSAYAAGFVLLEVDGAGQPVAAYQKPGAAPEGRAS